MPPFFIHYEDPGFPEQPFPNERRLGPFLTQEEAVAQAVSDAALGIGVPLGIYPEAESEKRREGSWNEEEQRWEPGRAGKAAYSRGQVEKRAVTMQRRLHAAAVAAQQEQAEALKAILPEGVTMSDLSQLATALRADRAEQAAREAP